MALKKFLSFLIFICITNSAFASKLINLDEDNWDRMLEGEWMVEFYAPWCPACKSLQPVWKDFANWGDDLGISVGAVDVTQSPGLSGRFMVTALPTIYHVKDGEFRQYRGSREKDQFMSYVEDRKWVDAEVVPAWKSPGSYQMAVVSQFFKLSMVLRGVHTTFVKDYGLPEWGSYLIFAFATIFVGALIGLILVCIIDFMFPPKPSSATNEMATTINDQEEDLLDSQDQSDSKESSGDEEKEEEPETESQREEEDSNTQQTVRKRKARRAD